jgi:hypothetical protein
VQQNLGKAMVQKGCFADHVVVAASVVVVVAVAFYAYNVYFVCILN